MATMNVSENDFDALANAANLAQEIGDRVPGLIQQALMGDERFRFELAPRDQSRALQVIDGSPHTRRPLLKRMFG